MLIYTDTKICTDMLIYTDTKMQKGMVLMVYSVLIQYYMFHSDPLASFLILITFFYNKHVETCCHPGPVCVVQIGNTMAFA
jgi:hypothetical protein